MKPEFTSLLLITALAAVVPFLASRLRVVRIPIVVGEILAGMVIGKSGLDLVAHTHALEFLAEFGFTFLMFLSGLEMDFSQFGAAGRKGKGSGADRRPLVLSGASFVLTVALALGVGAVLAQLGLCRNWILMGLVLSTTSLGIVVPVLKERSLTHSRYGQVLLVTALIGDFATLLLLSVAIALLSHGPSVDVLFVLLLLVAFVLAVRAGQRARRIPVLTRAFEELSHATAQVRVRGALALMVGWVVLAQALGAEIILGAFLAGAIVSLMTRDRDSMLFEKLDAMGYGFFIPVFFIQVGAGFDLSVLAGSRSALVLLVFLVAAAFLVKVLPALLFRALFDWRRTLGAGFLLSSRLSLIISAGAIPLELGLMSEATNSALVLVAVVTCTFSPILFGLLVPADAAPARRGTLIVGPGDDAALLARQLRSAGREVTLVGSFIEEGTRERKQLRLVEGEPDDAETLARAGAGEAAGAALFLDEPHRLVTACRLLRERFGVPRVIATADEPGLVAWLESLGVVVVQLRLSAVLAVARALDFPASLEAMRDPEHGVELARVEVGNDELLGRSVLGLQLPAGVKILGIRRSGRALTPDADSVFERGDVVVLAGGRGPLEEASERIGRPSHGSA